MSVKTPSNKSQTKNAIEGNPSSGGVNFTLQNYKPLPKSQPESLREEINAADAKAGARIAIISNKEGEKGNLIYTTNKFYLSNMQIPYKEKAQVLETFGASAVSFFGQSTSVYSFSGLLLDWPSHSPTPAETMHGSSFIQFYQNHLRGTQLVQNKRIAVLQILNHLIYGYPLNFQTGYSSGSDKTQSFSMSWVVTDHSLAMPGLFTEEDLELNYLPVPNSTNATLVSQIAALQNRYTEICSIEFKDPLINELVNRKIFNLSKSFLSTYGSDASVKNSVEGVVKELINLFKEGGTADNIVANFNNSTLKKSFLSDSLLLSVQSDTNIDTNVNNIYTFIQRSKQFMDKLQEIKLRLS